MEKEFVPYEQALALKELGFDELCFACWRYKKNHKSFEKLIQLSFKYKLLPNKALIGNNIGFNCTAPTFSQTFRWFREKYGLEHKILRDSYGCRYQITKETPTILEDIDCNGQYSNTSYEEAELECLIKLIEIVKEPK